jgi:tyrosine-protein phosphatase
VEVIPGLYIGSEENARDWEHLTEKCNVGRVVNVAKELVSGAGLDSVEEVSEVEKESVPLVGKGGLLGAGPMLRPAISTPNLREPGRGGRGGTGAKPAVAVEKTYSLPNGKQLEYLHLPWSHGQADLVPGRASGFVKAGEFVAEGMSKRESVLVQYVSSHPLRPNRSLHG